MELLSDPCVRLWHGRMGSSWYGAWRTFVKFFDEVLTGHPVFGDMSPSQLVEWQFKATGRDRYVILVLAQNHIDGLPLRYKTKSCRLSYVRSFFMHNHAPLPEDRSFHFKSDLPPVEGNLTFDDFRKILHNCNKMYRPVFMMMGSGLLDESGLVYVSNNYAEEVLKHLTKNDGVFKLTLPGRKRNRNVKNFFTMLDTRSDWGDVMWDYIKTLPSMPRDVLFRNERGNPLTAKNIQYYFHWRAVETGVIQQVAPPCTNCRGETVRCHREHPSGLRKIAYQCPKCGNVDWACDLEINLTSVRYGVNPHEIRDLMRSRWRASGAKVIVAEFMMGHEIDPNEYDKMKYTPSYPIGEYLKALPWLNILSEDPTKVDRTSIDSELQSYRVENELLRKEVGRVKQHINELQKIADDPVMQNIKNIVEVEGGRQFFERLLKKMDKETDEWLKKTK